MSLMPRLPLHTRIALVFGATLSVSVALVLLLWVDRSERYELELTQRLNRDVARHLAEHAVPLTPGGIDEAELQGMLMHVMSVNPSLEVYLLDGEGEILAFDAPEGHVKLERVGLEPVRALLDREALPVLGDDPRSPGTRRPISVWPLEVGERRLGYVYVVLNSELLRATAGPLRGSEQLEAFALSAAAVLLLGIGANYFLARRLTRPLRELSDAIGRRRHDLPRRLLQADDELAQLARTHVEMSERIEEQLASLERVDSERREFVASVSHDLRTPLAALQGYLDLIEERSGELSLEQREHLRVARRQAVQLGKLVDQLFQLAKLEAGDVQPELEPFNLAELTQDVLQGLRQRAALRGIKLRCRLPRELPAIQGDLGLLERAVTNLVDNALKFSPEGGEVQVRLAREARGVRWSVEDQGPGVARDERERIFERSFRGRRSGQAAGSGLGLAITRRVLELHGAEVSLESDEGCGSRFGFRLAAARD